MVTVESVKFSVPGTSPTFQFAALSQLPSTSPSHSKARAVNFQPLLRTLERTAPLAMVLFVVGKAPGTTLPATSAIFTSFPTERYSPEKPDFATTKVPLPASEIRSLSVPVNFNAAGVSPVTV